MTRWMKNACLILALAATLFCSIGYAALSDTLQITGQVQVERPDKIFIAEIYQESIKITEGNFQTDGKPTAIEFPSAKYVSHVGFNSNQGKVTFEVKLVNGTSITQIYDRVDKKTLDGTTKPEDVEVTVEYKDGNVWKKLDQGYQFPAGATLDCRVTITSKKKVTSQMLHEFIFVTNPKDLTQHVSQPLLAKYDALINNHDLYGAFGSYGEPPQDLWLYGGGNHTGAYISNSSAYSEEQRNAVNDALDNITKITINGQEMDVTVLLKQQDVCDWVAGEERLIYFTADPLDDRNNQNAPVFVCVFYLDAASGKWLPIGGQEDGEYMIFEGTANVCDKNGQTGTGNFDTNNWHPSQEYFGVNPNPTGYWAQKPTLNNLMDAYEDQYIN